MKKITISIQVDEELYKYIIDKAKKEGLSISAYIRRLIIKSMGN